MAKFISDDEMNELEAKAPTQPKAKRIISDEDMIKMESKAPDELGSAGRGALQGATAGFADEISGATEALWNMAKGDSRKFGEMYKAYRDESRENFKKAEEANPKSFMAGNVGGAVATSLIPGMGGASIGKLALQGAAQGLGSSEADLTEGDVVGAVKDTAMGAGTGAAIGGASKLLSAGASKLAPSVNKLVGRAATGLEEGAEKLAVKATGATGSQAMKFSDDAGRQLLDRGLVRPFDNAAKIAERVGGASDDAGRAIQEALETLQSKGVTASVDNVVVSLESKIDDLAQTPGNERLIKQLQAEVDNLYNRGQSNIPISQGEIAKRNFQGQTNYFSPEAEKKASAQVGRAFKEEVEQAAQKADPTTAALFKQEKETYGLLAPIKEAAEKRAAQQAQSPFGGLTDVVAGAAAGPQGLVSKYAIEQIGRRAASTSAVLSDNVAKALKNSPQSFGKFAKPLQDAMARGGNSLAATHFILQQTQPEYRKLVNTSEEDREEQK